MNNDIFLDISDLINVESLKAEQEKQKAEDERKKREEQRRIQDIEWLEKRSPRHLLVKKIAEMLKERGIEISIYGCGCCDSPLVSLIIDGELVVDQEGEFNIDMINDDEE